MDNRLTSVSLRFVSPPNRTVTSSGASLILCITTRSCFMRSSAWPLQLSRWDVIRQNFWPLKSTWFQRVRQKKKKSNLLSTMASWTLHNENLENYVCANLSNKEIPHHLSGGVRYYLALLEFDPRLLQHYSSEVTLFTTWTVQVNRRDLTVELSLSSPHTLYPYI